MSVNVTDIGNFCRKLRLNEYFFKPNEANDNSVISNETATMDEPTKSLVTNPSKFCPGRNHYLDTYINTLEKYPLQEKVTNAKSNVSNSEWKATLELKNNPEIVRKQADRGSGMWMWSGCVQIIIAPKQKPYYKKRKHIRRY